jgi:hypothetical protein
VRADVFKRGYGYGLDASGGAGPDINPAALASVMRSKGRPQIDVERLREILEATK